MILWTVRLAVALYGIAVWRRLSAGTSNSADSTDRLQMWTWAGSWILCVIHVLCAFHFEHRWSHTAAIRHTAEMTERVVGIHWGGGLYINYIFLIWWGWSVLQAFRVGRSHPSMVLEFTAAFMMFNATAVFGPQWWWIPVCVFGAILGIQVALFRKESPDLQ